MDSNAQLPDAVNDDLTRQADDLQGGMSQASDYVDKVAQELPDKLEQGLDSATQKLDSFLSGIDKFFK